MRPGTILPCYQQVNLTRARDPIGKPTLGQRSTSQKHVTSMSCKLKPAIWSRGTGQRIACFDRCQLIIAGMSNIKEVHGKLRLYVSFLEYGCHVGQLCRRRRHRRAYAPTSNTASQDNHEKINSWVSFIFPLHDEYGAPLGGPLGRRSSANNMGFSCRQLAPETTFFSCR